MQNNLCFYDNKYPFTHNIYNYIEKLYSSHVLEIRNFIWSIFKPFLTGLPFSSINYLLVLSYTVIMLLST